MKYVIYNRGLCHLNSVSVLNLFSMYLEQGQILQFSKGGGPFYDKKKWLKIEDRSVYAYDNFTRASV